jgi:hypothetical protein
MSIGGFRKRTKYTIAALHPEIFQGIIIYLSKGKW